jgi:hypothetical protein
MNMKQRLVLLVTLSLMMIATTASAQWVACTAGSVGSVTCTNSKAAVGNTVPQRDFVISGAGTATFQLSTRAANPTAIDGFQFQQVGLNSHLINEEDGLMAFWTKAVQRVTITNTGNMGIGTAAPAQKLHVVGAIQATGNITSTGGTITATYADIAEWVPSDNELKDGMVVVIDGDSDDHVNASTVRYATNVAGVVSPKPGILLGLEADDKHKVATTGRVKVRATTQNGPIRRGDLLVTSDIPGTAMRSVPITINGRTFHQPGTIVGKALEPLESGTGEILALLTLQ